MNFLFFTKIKVSKRKGEKISFVSFLFVYLERSSNVRLSCFHVRSTHFTIGRIIFLFFFFSYSHINHMYSLSLLFIYLY